jgi:threonine dehydrogenase-like Zn-dependent dehydrogenase
MKGLQFHYSVPRLAATMILSRVWSRAYLSPLAPVRLESVPEPELPADDWVRVRTGLAGICGSDATQITLHGSFDNPLRGLLSFPHVLGHEAMGTIESVGDGVRQRQVGERVAVNPWLSCVPRGIDPPCPACQRGEIPLCRNFDRGPLPRSLHLGNNTRVPGAFAPLFICHESQCFPVPDEVPDEAAVLADPFSVCLHAVVRNPPADDAPALVYGLGTLGILTVAILRALYPEVEVYAIGRYPHQAKLAAELGASVVLAGPPADLVQGVAKAIGATPLEPPRGLPWLLDGVGIVYDIVGSATSLETAIRLVHSGGRVVVAGVGIPKRFEWTPIYFKEVTVVGSNAFGFEPYHGEKRHAIDIYLELANQGLSLGHLVTHRFPLAEWRDAFKTLGNKRKTGAVKVVFDFDMDA